MMGREGRRQLGRVIGELYTIKPSACILAWRTVHKQESAPPRLRRCPRLRILLSSAGCLGRRLWISPSQNLRGVGKGTPTLEETRSRRRSLRTFSSRLLDRCSSGQDGPRAAETIPAGGVRPKHLPGAETRPDDASSASRCPVSSSALPSWIPSDFFSFFLVLKYHCLSVCVVKRSILFSGPVHGVSQHV